MRAGLQRPGHAPACCRVFITHMHGDHIFGLPGLLRAISRRCQELAVAQPDTVRIYGPPGALIPLAQQHCSSLSNHHHLNLYSMHDPSTSSGMS